MNVKHLYIIAAVLALCAAALTMYNAETGEDVMLRVGLLAAAGVGLLYAGLRNRNASAN